MMKSISAIVNQLKRAKADEVEAQVRPVEQVNDSSRVRLTSVEREADRNTGGHFGPSPGFASLGDPYGANMIGHDALVRFYQRRRVHGCH
jgi:hypothetical protein